MSIKINNITKIYGSQKALNNVSFEIKNREIVGFLGPNGAGKSTLMKIITGFIAPTSGNIFVNDKNILEHSTEIKNNIGYLPENNPLYLDMYILEYLNFVAGFYKINNKKERIKNVIHLTGLEPEIHKKIGTLSKGFRQRVGLAQAIIHNPDFLILDEPTSGLDPNQIIEIRNLILNLGKEKTVMLSTHIMQEVEAICDKIVIINKGSIVANDDTETIQNINNKNTDTLIIEFSQTINKEIIKKISGVINIKNLDNNNLEIEYDSNIDIRKDLFNLAVSENNAVLSMQKKEHSLEKVFNQLTIENYNN